MILTAAFALALLSDAGSSAGPISPACAAANAALSAAPVNAEKLLYSTGLSADWKREVLKRRDLAEGWRGRAPTPALLQQLKASAARSALDCPNVRTLAQSRGALVEDARLVSTLAAIGLKPSKTMAYRISMPVIGGGGREALVLLSSSSNQLGGDAWLLLLVKRDDGSWSEEGRKLLYLA